MPNYYSRRICLHNVLESFYFSTWTRQFPVAWLTSTLQAVDSRLSERGKGMALYYLLLSYLVG